MLTEPQAIGRDAPRLAKAQHVETGARRQGRQEEIEGRDGASLAPLTAGLVRMHNKRSDEGIDSLATGEGYVDRFHARWSRKGTGRVHGTFSFRQPALCGLDDEVSRLVRDSRIGLNLPRLGRAPTGVDAPLKKYLTSSYDEALKRLPDALKNEGFGVLTEVDLAQTLKNKLGVDFRRYRIFGACNPTLAHGALSVSLDVGVLLPCNVAVYEGDNGRAVVQTIDPMQTMAAGDPRLAEVAATVRAKLVRVLEQLS